MNKFEEFEKDFASALPGAKCVKIEITFITADDEVAKVGAVREGCEDPEDDPRFNAEAVLESNDDEDDDYGHP